MPFYGPTAMSFPGGPTAAQYTNESIDPQLTHPRDYEDDEDEDKAHGMGQPQHPHPQEQLQHHHNGTGLSEAIPLDARSSSVPDDNPNPSPNPNPAAILAPPPLPPQPDRDRRPQPLTSRRSVPSFVTHRDLSVEQTQAQTVQALERLTEVTQALVDQMTALTGLMEQAKHGGGLSGARPEDGLNRKEKASLATEMLANSGVGEEVRRAAADYLKRLFMSE